MFLLKSGAFSHVHKGDAAEIIHYHYFDELDPSQFGCGAHQLNTFHSTQNVMSNDGFYAEMKLRNFIPALIFIPVKIVNSSPKFKIEFGRK